MTKLNGLIDKHKKFYNKNEKQLFDKARRYYRGDFWTMSHNANALGNDTALNFLCSKNLIYAIADTAVSALLGPNPQVTANPRNQLSQDFAPAATGLLEYVFKSNKMRRRAATTLIDAVLCKRGIFKTGWSKEEDRPLIRAVDPSSIFFDLAVRDVDDIRYWLEATVLPWSTFKARVDRGQYSSDKLADIRPDRYPKWLLDENQRGDSKSVRDAVQWVTVWEYYNRETNKVQHYVQQADTVVFEDDIDYIPYSMYSLNQSGVDCLGLSEVQLVLNQQETVNDLLTHWKKIVYLMVPRILYDSGRITEEDLNKAVEASVGSFVGITPQNSEALRTLATLFYEMPLPDTPIGVKEFVARQEDDAAFISALAEAARGQVTGARTATEMAIIDAQMRTRLATREGHINAAIEDVASKAFYLCKKYMKEEKMVRVSGNRKWLSVDLDSIRDVDVGFEMVSYNPIKQNPSVISETLLQVIPFLAESDHVDNRRLIEEVVTGLGLPQRLMMPEDEVAQLIAMQGQMQMQMAQGGAGAPPGPPVEAPPHGAEGGQPPSPEEAFAAGGGAPVREAEA